MSISSVLFHRSPGRRGRRWRCGLLAGGVAAALVLSACASDDGGSDVAGGAESAAESAGESAAGAGETAAGSAAGAGETAAESAASAGESAAESAGGTGESTAESGSESGSAGPSGSAGSDSAAPTELTDADIAAAKETLADPSVLTVCTSLPYQPFEADDGSGNIVGFDMDFMDWMAEVLGTEKKVVDADFSGVQSGQAMKAGTCDIAAAGMTITDERSKVIEFSDGYYDASQTLMVLSDSPIATLADAKGKKVGAQSGTTGLLYANKHAEEFGYTVIEYQKITDEEQALQAGNIDAAIHDLPALAEYVKQQDGKVKIVENFDTGEEYGFGAAKGNTALIKVANYVIAQSKADGRYAESYQKWTGQEPPTS